MHEGDFAGSVAETKKAGQNLGGDPGRTREKIQVAKYGLTPEKPVVSITV